MMFFSRRDEKHPLCYNLRLQKQDLNIKKKETEMSVGSPKREK